MKNELQRALRLLFQRTSIERILALKEENKIYYDDIAPEYLQDLLLTYSNEFSDTERRLQLDEIQNQIDYNRFRLVSSQEAGKLNVFSILLMYVPDILTFYENYVVFRYERIFEWNKLTRVIGEELPVLLMIVLRDLQQSISCKNFCWSPIIGHNNSRFNKILNQGMAENHFHLRGSSPHFFISWIKLMNNPDRDDYLEQFENLEMDYRDKNKKSEVLVKRQPLRILAAQAALIRYYLCCRIKQIPLGIFDCAEPENEIKRILATPYLLENHIFELQVAIDSYLYENETEDYAVIFANSQYIMGKTEKKDEVEYRILSGERWFIYCMLKELMFNERKISRDEFNWFYAYLRIKNEIRTELVQVNESIGFENFQIYQSRKDLFSHIGNWQDAEKRLARMAILDLLNNPAIKSLEVRISPANTAAENAYYIKLYDEAVAKQSQQEDCMYNAILKGFSFEEAECIKERCFDKYFGRRFFYVFHFTKKRDKPLSDFEMLECRHYEYRNAIKRKADEILRFRRDYPKYGRRVIGIDACAQEIGCRPEVFGRVFRMLKNHSYLHDDEYSEYPLPQLKVTYHVGEDFLDLSDGLRAIDEAIRFLDMGCGDRLGHALALGIDAKEWYSNKNRQITIPLQDYLDNIVWMHHALIRYNISEINSLKGWLEEQYSRYFAYIYQDSLQDVLNSPNYIKFNTPSGKFDLNTYYYSWLLRGDQPNLYKLGKFDKDTYMFRVWEHDVVNSPSLIRSDDIRYIPEVSLLYHMYHYSRKARKIGGEIKTFHIPDNYIDGVAKIQKAMCEDIVSRGIAVETNPSSNISIGNFSEYSEHPIKNLYNLGLTKNEQSLMECPQVNVSINTDDKGIFSTKLENEYALLACAFENVTDSNGKPLYKREFIYDWLNNIRKMGIQQSFISSDDYFAYNDFACPMSGNCNSDYYWKDI